MILTKAEWQTYKQRNIKRLVEIYFANLKIMHNKVYNFIHKHPNLKKYFLKCLEKKFKFDFRMSKKASFPNLDFQITTRCTLACEQCCSLMLFFTNETHNIETFETFKIKLDNLLKDLFLREYIDACDYCHTNCNIKIARGVQIKQ